MDTIAPIWKTRITQWIQHTLLLFALLTSPALCCGSLQVLDALPPEWLPGPMSLVVNLFEEEARIENRTSETLYMTAITTTYGDGDPRVIPQNIAFRRHSIPVAPQGVVAIQHDAADLPLAGIVVCRNDDDCRLLPAKGSGVYEINSYDTLSRLNPAWRQAIKAQPEFNALSLMIAVLSSVSILLFSGWLYLKRGERQRAG